MALTLEPLLFRAGQAMDLEIIKPLRAWTICRKAIAANPNIKGEGIYSVDKLRQADVGPATISYQLPRPSDARDAPRLTRENVQLPILQHKTEIDRKEFNALMNYAGGAIDITRVAAESAAYQMAVKEDILVFMGSDEVTPNIDGFYNGATTSYTTEIDFGNGDYFGNLTKGVAGAMGMLADYGVVPPNGNYHLFMNAEDYMYAAGIQSILGIPEMVNLKNLLRGFSGTGAGSVGAGPGDIWKLPQVTITDPGTGKSYTITAMTKGTALLLPDDPTRTWLEEYIIQDVKTSLGYDSKDPNHSPIYSTLTSIVYPHLKQPHAACSITNIVQS